MEDLSYMCSIRIEQREGEDIEDTKNRLFNIMCSDLCNLADHQIDFEIHGLQE